MPSKKHPRLLLVSDEEGMWYLRTVRSVWLDLDVNQRIYRCDKHIGGPYKKLEEAVEKLKARVRHAR